MFDFPLTQFFQLLTPFTHPFRAIHHTNISRGLERDWEGDLRGISTILHLESRIWLNHSCSSSSSTKIYHRGLGEIWVNTWSRPLTPSLAFISSNFEHIKVGTLVLKLDFKLLCVACFKLYKIGGFLYYLFVYMHSVWMWDYRFSFFICTYYNLDFMILQEITHACQCITRICKDPLVCIRL